MNAIRKINPDKHIAFIGLGSNVEPEKNLVLAIGKLRRSATVLEVSSVWHSPAFGTIGPDFLNAVAKLEVDKSAGDLKNDILRPIEKKLGRRYSQNKNAPRAIDLDILVFDKEIKDPHIWDYPHLAVPLAECFPNLIAPSGQRTISQIASDLRKTNDIQRSSINLA